MQPCEATALLMKHHNDEVLCKSSTLNDIDLPPNEPEDQASLVSSSWLVELLQDCFCKDVEVTLDRQLLPQAREIEHSVKVKCLISSSVLYVSLGMLSARPMRQGYSNE